MPTLKGVSRGQPTPPDHHRGHARRRAGEGRRGAARRGLPAAACGGARCRRRGRRDARGRGARAPGRALLRGERAGSCSSTSPGAGRFAPRPPRRMRVRGSSRSRPRRACLKLHSRLWRSSPTSGRSAGRRSRASAASTSTASSPGLAERGLIGESGRENEFGAIRYRTTPLFERIFGLESLAALPRVDDLGADVMEIRERLEAVAEKRPA